MYVYGSLTNMPISITPLDVLQHSKQLKQLHIMPWKSSKTQEEWKEITSSVVSLMGQNGPFQTTISKEMPIRDLPQVMQEYKNNMSGGKILLNCNF